MKILEAQTFKERLESKLSYQDKNHVDHSNIEAVLTRPEGSYLLREWHFGHNIVTSAGDVYYSQMAAGVAVTNDFKGANSRNEFRTGADTPAAGDTYDSVNGTQTGTKHALDATYPKCPDTDTDNTGLGTTTATYRYSYTTAEGNVTGIIGGSVFAVTSPTTGTPLLCHYSISTFDKTSSDTLKFYVNHTFLHQ